ncbi:MAG: hypothetical protein JWM80_2180 [Cyanobacteria bacterium RYN_339]|nr:hypothetical protein [Cyanobacteria bacterium RYN_339]
MIALLQALAAEPAVELGGLFLTESLPAGALDVGPMPVPFARVAGRVGLGPGWELAGHLQYAEYTLVDGQAPDSRHHRDDFDFGGQLAYTLPTASVQPWVAAGYGARYVAVANSVAAPLTQPLLFSPAQLYHGPRFAAGWAGPLRPEWRIDLEGGFRPYLFAAGDAAVASLAPLYGYDASAGLTWSAGAPLSVRAALGYDGQAAYYNDFKRAAVGPSLRAAWAF